LNTDVYGIRITTTAPGIHTYERVLMEQREFASPWPPIPYSEVFNAKLMQNEGW
jgi:hypothetical protein